MLDCKTCALFPFACGHLLSLQFVSIKLFGDG